MIRNSFLDKFGPECTTASQDLIYLCFENMVDRGDFLLCYQNGFIFDQHVMVGYGEETYSIQRLNTIIGKGIGLTTDNDNYFSDNSKYISNGMSEIERTTSDELYRYMMLWENLYFLRLLTQFAHLLNGEHYDWNLDIKKETKNGTRKYKYITELIKKFEKADKFYHLIDETYNNNIRNAVAHSQYYFVKGGFLLRNIKSENGVEKGLSFEEWERIFTISYMIIYNIHQALEIMRKQYFLFAKNLKTNCVPIIVPVSDNNWERHCLYPDKDGRIWRFVK